MKYIYIISFLILFLIAGCTGINLNRAVIPGELDWIMAGGSSEQQNIAKSIVNPPLEVEWSYNLDAGIGYSAFSVSDEVLFVNNLQGEMYSIDIPSGGKIGQINFLGKDANTTPLVLGNDVIVTFAGSNKFSIVSYSLLGGEINWRKKLGDIQTSPMMKDGYIYVGSLGGKFYKLDKDGKLIWFFKAGSPIHSTCVISGNNAVFGSDKGVIYCLDTESGSKKWEYKADAPVFTAPLAFDDKIFIGSDDSNYVCIDINSGNKIWSQNLKTKIFSGSALYKAEAVIFGGVNGSLYSLNIKDGSVNWKFRSYGVITGSPVVSGDNIYFSSYDKNIYCLKGSSGEKLWSYEMDGKGKTSPVIYKNFLFAADDQNVICFTNKTDAK